MGKKTVRALTLILLVRTAAAQSTALPPIVVRAPRETGYAPGDIETGALGGESATVLRTPASVSVFTRAALDDQGQSTLTDAVRHDAFAGDSYAPVGYYQNIQLRGFPLDLGTGYRINGLTVVGEQNIALENKSRLEVWNGAAGLESGASSPGGMVNEVTKRPDDVRAVTVGAGASGGRDAAVDFGFLFGEDRRSGLRVNAAREDLSPPIRHADGHREFAGFAADWGYSDGGLLRVDLEDQRRVQDSVPGYQLLGGTQAPPLPDPARLLGWQPWTRPVAVDSLNASARLDQELGGAVRLHAAAGRSQARIDDNIAFPYGCGGLTTFCANGDYTIYDFRSSGERRRSDDFVLSLSGGGPEEARANAWTAGAEYFARAVDMSSWIYIPVGTDNIFNPNPAVLPPSGAAAPTAYRTLDHVQRSLFARDILSVGRWDLRAGARWTLVRETTDDPAAAGAELAASSSDRLLPELGALYRLDEETSLYGTYSEGLELGGVAPAYANNPQAVLPAVTTRQVEAGVKRRVGGGLLLTAAAFRAQKPYQYLDGNNDFVQNGREVHTGLEAAAAGEAAPGLRLQASAAYLRALQQGTGTPSYDGRQVPNVPAAQAALFLDQALPFLPGAGLFAGGRWSSSRPVLPDGSVRVPGAQVFDAGARHAFSYGRVRVTLRLSVDNVFDARYWRDAAQQYLFTGLPRTGRLSATVDF